MAKLVPEHLISMLKLKLSPSLAVFNISRDSEVKIFAESGESVSVPACVGTFMHTHVYMHKHMPVCVCVSFFSPNLLPCFSVIKEITIKCSHYQEAEPNSKARIITHGYIEAFRHLHSAMGAFFWGLQMLERESIVEKIKKGSVL